MTLMGLYLISLPAAGMAPNVSLMKRSYLSSKYQRSRSYSPAVITEGGKTVWLAGHLAWQDKTGHSLENDFDGQVRCIFENIGKTLNEAGGSLSDIVTMTIFLTNVMNNSRFVEIRKEFFVDPNFPASTLVTVAALNRPDLLIEINAVAVID